MQTHDSRPVPKSATPSRRTFLKGALIAAATPAIAVAPLLPDTIGGLIAAYNDNRKMLNAVDAEADALWDSPNRPRLAFVAWDEMPVLYRWKAHRDGYACRNQLHSFFDGERGVIEYNTGIGMPKSVADRRAKEIEEGRASVLALYDERDAVYRNWRVSSGYAAVLEEQERLSDIDESLDQKIVGYRCETLEDARLKAIHMKKSYNEISSETAWKFVQSFLI